MFIIEIAKLRIKVNNKYKFLEKQCEDYIVDSLEHDLEFSVTDDEIAKEQNASPDPHSLGYLESICLYRKIALNLPKYDCILLHAAIVKVDNLAYGFSAKSGTGKTTHTRLWKQLLGDKMSYVNGDKPIIRIIDGKPYAFGTPWNGKEGYGDNTYAELKALTFIERNNNNSITLLPKKDILSRIIHQILLPKDQENLSKTFDILNILLSKINIYLLKCNMDIEAAEIAYNTIKKGVL